MSDKETPKIKTSAKTIAWYAVNEGLPHEIDEIARRIEDHYKELLGALEKKVLELDSYPMVYDSLSGQALVVDREAVVELIEKHKKNNT